MPRARSAMQEKKKSSSFKQLLLNLCFSSLSFEVATAQPLRLRFSLFRCQLLGYVSRRCAFQSATTTRKGQFRFVKTNKNSRSLAETMKRIVKQIRKPINPPRKSASETREPFRSQVINGAQRKEDRRREAIGFEIPVTRGAIT